MNDKERERRIKREMETCVFFTGIHQNTCKAGISYRELVGGPQLGWARKIPCTQAWPHETERVSCAKLLHLTRQEAEAEVEADDKRMQRTLKAIKETHAHAKKNSLGIGHGGHGELECPACEGGVIEYIVASVNGHIHGRCSTPNCVSWME
jgi:hypothetical protein